MIYLVDSSSEEDKTQLGVPGDELKAPAGDMRPEAPKPTHSTPRKDSTLPNRDGRSEVYHVYHFSVPGNIEKSRAKGREVKKP